LVRNVHFKQAARKHRPVNQHYFIFQILTKKKSLPIPSLKKIFALEGAEGSKD